MSLSKIHQGFPCATDLAFFQARRLPLWARDIKAPAPQIDSVVNAHAGRLRHTSGEVAAHNLMVILAGATRRGASLDKMLTNIAEYPACAISPEKRSAFARKWALRLGLAPRPYAGSGP